MYGLTAFERDPFFLLDPFSDFDDRFVSKETVRSFKTDIREEDDKFIMEAELPGFEKGEIQLDVNGDTLTLSAGKLVWITVGMFGIQSDTTKHLNNNVIPFLFTVRQLMHINGFPNDISNGHSRIQTCIRILEYNLHLPAQGLGFLDIGDVLAVK